MNKRKERRDRLRRTSIPPTQFWVLAWRSYWWWLSLALLNPACRSLRSRSSFGSTTSGPKRASDGRRSCDALHQLQDYAQREPPRLYSRSSRCLNTGNIVHAANPPSGTTDSGFSLKEGVWHPCKACGREPVLCCATRRGAGVTEGMEKQ